MVTITATMGLPCVPSAPSKQLRMSKKGDKGNRPLCHFFCLTMPMLTSYNR